MLVRSDSNRFFQELKLGTETMMGGLCFSGCCARVGFDEQPWDYLASHFLAQGVEYITNIAGNVSAKLDSSISMLFAGNHDFCGNAIRFPGSEWLEIKAWLEAGGKMVICSEHSGNAPDNGLPLKCLQDMVQLNIFLSGMGTSLSYIGDDCNGGFPDSGFYIPGSAKVAQGVTDFGGARFGELAGGTTVFTGYAGGPDGPQVGWKNGLGRVAVVADPVGDGFIFLTGDSNLGLVANSGSFFRKVFDTPKEDML
jgi:hypothetical protein